MMIKRRKSRKPVKPCSQRNGAQVEDLKVMLGRTDAHLPLIEDRMKSVHAIFDGAAVELRADGIQVGFF